MAKGPTSDSHVELSCHVSLVSFSLEHFLFSLAFHDFNGQLFCSKPLNLGFLFNDKIQASLRGLSQMWCVCVCMHVCAQLCLILCDPVDHSPPESPVLATSRQGY